MTQNIVIFLFYEFRIIFRFKAVGNILGKQFGSFQLRKQINKYKISTKQNKPNETKQTNKKRKRKKRKKPVTWEKLERFGWKKTKKKIWEF
jgi:hypothetical protein